jgi:SAM-dependent methyltransferase
MAIAHVTQASSEPDRIRRVYAGRRREERYAGFQPAQVFTLQSVERKLLCLLRQFDALPLRDRQILEVGCGTGYWLRQFVKWGADPCAVTGVDLLAHSLAVAKRLGPGDMRLLESDGAVLPFPDEAFDVVAHFTVFTSILDPVIRRRVAEESVRVLKPRGLVVCYDFHIARPNNSDVRPLTRRDIVSLFPGCALTLRRVTLAPPLVRLLAPRSWLLCSLLETIPLLRTHYLGVIQKPEL